jgi:Uma2 family endonuclease
LAVEVLSPGTENERRHRVAKLKLYDVRGICEYRILDWRRREVEVYRRDGGRLVLAATLRSDDILESDLLPGYRCEVSRFFD